MFVSESKIPEVSRLQEQFAGPQDKKTFQKGEGGVDFDKMLAASNALRQEELEKEKASSSDGKLHIGETKDTQKFREQLEKITGKAAGKPKNKLDQSDYLTLLVTQLKYQDPSKPMEHYEMASQMAQFNTVEQLVGVNKALANMGKAQGMAVGDKLTQYLDKNVEVEGNHLQVAEDGSVTKGRFQLPSFGSSVAVEISNEDKKIVRTLMLGSQQAGSHDISWDGKDSKNLPLPKGNYSFHIRATTEDGNAIKVSTSYLTKVTGVSDLKGKGTLESSNGPIDSEKIIAIRLAQTEGVRNAIH